jgi:uncharacterized protein (TIGR02453 family)
MYHGSGKKYISLILCMGKNGYYEKEEKETGSDHGDLTTKNINGLKIIKIWQANYLFSSASGTSTDNFTIFVLKLESMINKGTLDFLKAIKKNNNKDWFEKNKDKYLAVKENWESVLDQALKGFVKFDKRFGEMKGKDCVYRIYRDVRFSPDKTPYKTHLGANVNVYGKKSMNAGYYIHIEPGKSFIAGGMWMPPGDMLKKVRQEIDYNAKDLRKILNNKSFKKYYGEFEKEYALKTTPKGYDKEHPEIEFLRLTSYIVSHPFTDAQVMRSGFVKEVVKGAEIMKPLIEFLNTALD